MSREIVIGAKYWKLTAIEKSKKGGTVRFRCDCGTELRCYASRVLVGARRSCGCFKWVGGVTTHGLSSIPEYRVWSGVIQRCTNPNRGDFPAYGGRGISVAPEWRSFEAFFASVGPRPSASHRLERKDNDGGYIPGNVVWADMREQTRNKRNSKKLTFAGRSMIIPDWAAEYGVSVSAIRYRLAHGWPIDRAITTPAIFKREGAAELEEMA